MEEIGIGPLKSRITEGRELGSLPPSPSKDWKKKKFYKDTHTTLKYSVVMKIIIS